MKRILVAQFVQLQLVSLCNLRLDVVAGERWSVYIDQSKMSTSDLLLQFVYLFAVFLRRNRFTGNLKAVMDDTSCRPPSTHHNPF